VSTGKLVVGVTGASGAIYAQRFLREAASRYEEILLILSAHASSVAETELGVKIDRASLECGDVSPLSDAPSSPKAAASRRSPKGPFSDWLGWDHKNIRLLDGKDYFTPPASGSFRHDGMVIVPCSMGTVGRLANGVSDDLLTRSADVCLKEGRKLILVPREMPWNLIHLRNLTQLAEAGATILPACPAWYHRPKTLEDLADTVVARILQSLGAEQELMKQWMADE
jgi:4-hydroxy-3-polyprenylbenzoate decarboxylase